MPSPATPSEPSPDLGSVADIPRVPTRLQGLVICLASAALTYFVAAVAGAVTKGLALQLGYPAEVVNDLRRSPLTTDPTWLALTTLPVHLTLFACIALWLRWLRLTRQTVLPLRLPGVRASLGSMLVLVSAWPLSGAAGELMYRWVGAEWTVSGMVVDTTTNATALEMMLVLGAFSLMPGITEEAMFRGLLTAPFRSRWGAVLVPALLFGLFHLDPVQATGTAVLGVAFGLSRVYTGSLLVPIALHAAHNALVLSLGRYVDTADHRIELWPLVLGTAGAFAGFQLLRSSNPPPIAAQRS